MFEKRKQYEADLYEVVKRYVKNEMSAQDKDRIYELAQPSKLHYEALRDNPRYAQKRDEFVARDLLATTLSYELPLDGLTNKFVKEYKKSWEKIATTQKYANNAIKGLDKFPAQLAEILMITGEAALDPNKVQYLGSNSYLYAGQIFISFINSPSSVEIRVY